MQDQVQEMQSLRAKGKDTAENDTVRKTLLKSLQ